MFPRIMTWTVPQSASNECNGNHAVDTVRVAASHQVRRDPADINDTRAFPAGFSMRKIGGWSPAIFITLHLMLIIVVGHTIFHYIDITLQLQHHADAKLQSRLRLRLSETILSSQPFAATTITAAVRYVVVASHFAMRYAGKSSEAYVR